jgi:hypothetical protein
MAVRKPVMYNTGYNGTKIKILMRLKYELIVDIWAEGCNEYC